MIVFYYLLIASLWIASGLVIHRLRAESSLLSPAFAWIFGLGFFILIPLSVIVLAGGYRYPLSYGIVGYWDTVDLSDKSFFMPMLVIWATLFLSLLVVYLLAREKPTFAPLRPLNKSAVEKVLTATLALSCTQWAILLYVLGGIEGLFLSHWYTRNEAFVEQLGDIFVLALRLQQVNQLIFISAAVLYLTAVDKPSKRWAVIIVLATLIEMVVSGNRIYVASFAFALLAKLWLNHKNRQLLKFFLAAPLLIIALTAWTSIRGNLTAIEEAIPSKYAEGDWRSHVTSTLIDSTEGSDLMMLLHIVKDFGSRYEFLRGASYLKTFTMVIPRSLYPDKPQSFAIVAANLYEPGVVTSVNATALGEMYANFGLLTIGIVPLLSVGIMLVQRRLIRRGADSIVSVALFLLIIWYARANFADSVLTFTMVWLAIRGFRLEKDLYRPTDPNQLHAAGL